MWQIDAAHHPEHTIPAEKHNSGSVMPWGSFSSADSGKLVRIEDKMDGAKYKTILEEIQLQSARDFRLGWRLMFQENGQKLQCLGVQSW